jgi:hypothetical protein
MKVGTVSESSDRFGHGFAVVKVASVASGRDCRLAGASGLCLTAGGSSRRVNARPAVF